MTNAVYKKFMLILPLDEHMSFKYMNVIDSAHKMKENYTQGIWKVFPYEINEQ